MIPIVIVASQIFLHWLTSSSSFSSFPHEKGSQTKPENTFTLIKSRDSKMIKLSLCLSGKKFFLKQYHCSNVWFAFLLCLGFQMFDLFFYIPVKQFRVTASHHLCHSHYQHEVIISPLGTGKRFFQDSLWHWMGAVPCLFHNMEANRKEWERAALFPICSATCMQVTLPSLELCLSGVFSCTDFHLCSTSATCFVPYARGAGGREASQQLGEATCIICQQRMAKSCHMYINFTCNREPFPRRLVTPLSSPPYSLLTLSTLFVSFYQVP